MFRLSSVQMIMIIWIIFFFVCRNQCSPSEFHTNSQPRDSAEQRKRSSSTSDTQRNRSRSNNNNVASSGNAYINNNSVNNNSGEINFIKSKH